MDGWKDGQAFLAVPEKKPALTVSPQPPYPIQAPAVVTRILRNKYSFVVMRPQHY